MICPVCNHDRITLLETRGERRRRECRRCLNRWTTYEIPAERLEKLERLEQAVREALPPEVAAPPPARMVDDWRPSADELARREEEMRARAKRDKQDKELERRQRLRKAYDEERKARGW